MEMRTLGRAGSKVSHLCLGGMMFGPWGNEDRNEFHRPVPPCHIDETIGALDEIVPSGTTLNLADAAYRAPSLSDASARRRLG